MNSIIILLSLLALFGIISYIILSKSSNLKTSAPTTSAPTTSAPTTSVPTISVPTTSVPTTSAPTTSAPTTSAPTTSAPTLAPCLYSNWSECNCLSKSQIRSIKQGNSSYCTEPLEQQCQPDASKCSRWVKFNNSYISGGEYYNRSCEPNHISCYTKCENDPNCAAVYSWDGPSGQSSNGCGSDKGNVECSLIPKENIGLLYQRYGVLSDPRFYPQNRNIFIDKIKAGDYLQNQSYQSPVV